MICVSVGVKARLINNNGDFNDLIDNRGRTISGKVSELLILLRLIRLTHQIIKYDNAHVFRPRLKFKLSDVNLSVNL